MEKYRGKDVNSLCRTCLELFGQGDYKFDVLLTPDLVKKMGVCTSLEPIEPSDIYPKNMCGLCVDKLDKLYEFQTMCIQSVKKVQEMINMGVLQDPTKFELEIPFLDVADVAILEDKEADQNQIGNENIKLEVEMSPPDPGAEISNEKQSDSEFEPNDDVEDSESEDESGEDIKQNSKEMPNKPKKKYPRTGAKFERIYQCDQCPKRFFKEMRYNAHLRDHQGLKPYVCPHPGCDREFRKHSGLGTHFRDIHSSTQQEFQCTEPGCTKTYSRKQTLQWHWRTVHKEGNVEPAKRSFMCEECGKTFKSITALKKHTFVHGTPADLPFECEECHKRYVTRHKLKEHMMRHAGIKNFICPYCGMKKTTRHELKTHINYHTKERQYPCKYCDQIFNSSGNQARHIRIVHEGVKEYPCQYCGRKFGKAETCKHHEMTHTGEKPHACPVCGRRFIQLVAMRVHLKRHERNSTRMKPPVTSTLDESTSISNVS